MIIIMVIMIIMILITTISIDPSTRHRFTVSIPLLYWLVRFKQGDTVDRYVLTYANVTECGMAGWLAGSNQPRCLTYYWREALVLELKQVSNSKYNCTFCTTTTTTTVATYRRRRN